MNYRDPIYTNETSGTITVHVPRAPRKNVHVHLVLFLLTLLTTLIAGAIMSIPEEDFVNFGDIYWFALTHLYLGIPFSITLMAILGAHEMGHYLMSRYHGINASLPYFIPIPPYFLVPIGTLGAFIRIRSPIPDRKSLFDVGIAGPLAGMMIAIPAMFIGLMDSSIVYVGNNAGGIVLGEPLFLKGISYIFYGHIPAGFDIEISPIAFAAWLGFLVTFLNLIPIGQLDGGHISYAVFGKYHKVIGKTMFFVLLVFGFVFGSFHWFVWALIIFFFLGTKHPPPLDIYGKLDSLRIILAIIALLIFIGTFIHNPISYKYGEVMPEEKILQQSI